MLLLAISIQPAITEVAHADDKRQPLLPLRTENSSSVGPGDPCDDDDTKPDIADEKDNTDDPAENNGDPADPTDPDVTADKDDELSPSSDQEDAYPVDDEMSVGLALHIEKTTGNVHTQLKICSGVAIRYNSLNADVYTALGYGWTHGNNIYLEELPDGNVVIVDGHGRVSKYLDNGDGTFIRPPTRKSDLYYAYGQYTLIYFDGSMIEFNTEANPYDVFYYISKYTDQNGQENEFLYFEAGVHTGRLRKIVTGADNGVSTGSKLGE